MSDLSLFKDYSSTSINTTWASSVLRLIPYGEVTKTILRQRYKTQITGSEAAWRDRYNFFLNRGYELRPRFHPEWVPSWVNQSIDPWECEDAVQQFLPMVMDATSTKDSTRVCIKRVVRKSTEIDLLRYLSSEHLRSNKNHSVPLLDTFSDDEAPETQYIVMPLLRSFDDPDFGAIGEVVDCVSQLLEGLAFLHNHLIAHCDLTSVNIMMDAAPIFPGGWHFSSPYLAPDGANPAIPLARIDHAVCYYIIDFDFAMQLQPADSYLVDDLGGRDRDPPELSRNQPYDPFKLDVFTLGNVFKKEIHRKYHEVEFLVELTDQMMIPDFRQRPTAKEAIQCWLKARPSNTTSSLRRRLPRRIETKGERVVYDAMSVARESLQAITRALKNDTQPTAGLL